ncbi:hypothetical protein FB390_1202 [Nocardia bhagyanarayanae]|uniref:Uncharacterized protein n=1 Tax=Nocardia bhagyanarayanae TaxID=1215925 RepID=A0A543F6Z0_9NOCA|nr:hypothetical protein FB390_1202 [Nocardia bhagyanarayanae]
MGYPVIPRTSVAVWTLLGFPRTKAAALAPSAYEYATPGVFPHNYPQMWKTLGKCETGSKFAGITPRPADL